MRPTASHHLTCLGENLLPILSRANLADFNGSIPHRMHRQFRALSEPVVWGLCAAPVSAPPI